MQVLCHQRNPLIRLVLLFVDVGADWRILKQDGRKMVTDSGLLFERFLDYTESQSVVYPATRDLW
jgi:hypothetical protein